MREPNNKVKQYSSCTFFIVSFFYLSGGSEGKDKGNMEYYVLINGIKEGPFSIEELKSKGISRETMVWKAGQSQWLPMYQVPELHDLLKEIPPEPPTAKRTMPKTWLVESILATLFCCLPFGIIGIINATKVDTLYLNGNYDEAMLRSNNARKWTLWALFSAIAFWILYLLIMGIIALSTGGF